jgi:beta-aspartyl-peptidase (threonine type)
MLDAPNIKRVTMKTKTLIYLLMVSVACMYACKNPGNTLVENRGNGEQERHDWAIVIHGGAGPMAQENMDPEAEKQYRQALAEALHTGMKILEDGGTALDAVEITIREMENNPLFNAGKGAVFTHEGNNELDAAIMDGSNLDAGAVAAVTDIKNPITAARAVMTKSPHVMLSGAGASEFAREKGLEMVTPDYFYTQPRWDDLQELLKKEKNGTVGCCALDHQGNLAAGTSTGGMDNKRYNRIGDTPIIGAGTYASNATCAISATGHGEYFIRWTVAHDISALMEYRGLTLAEAAELVVNDKLVKAGGSGGVIGVDRKGNIVMSFNSAGMFRAFANAGGEEGVYIFKTEGKE